MKLIARQSMGVPIEKIPGIDSFFGRMMKIDPNDIPKKFKDNYNKTKGDSYKNFTIEAIYETFKVVENANDKVRLESGAVIENKLLSQVLSESSEILFCVICLNGYEELEDAHDDMIYKLFLDSWGTAFLEKAYIWLKGEISNNLAKDGLHTTHSFSPGQNDIPMEMQKLIFEHLEPAIIGVTLNDSYMMHPKKSISGIIGIGSCNDGSKIRPCDICERKTTCNWSHSDQEDEH